jgi:hypothetical protein
LDSESIVTEVSAYAFAVRTLGGVSVISRKIETGKDKASQKVADNIPPKLPWLLGAFYKPAITNTARLERFSSEYRGHAYQK